MVHLGHKLVFIGVPDSASPSFGSVKCLQVSWFGPPSILSWHFHYEPVPCLHSLTRQHLLQLLLLLPANVACHSAEACSVVLNVSDAPLSMIRGYTPYLVSTQGVLQLNGGTEQPS